MFRRLYDSPWHNPFAFLVVAAVVIVLLLARRPSAPRAQFVWRWALFFAVEIACDAFVTGGWSPLLPEHAAWIGTAAVPFVILGDYRWFLLIERSLAAPADLAATPRRPFGIACLWAFIVPVLAFGTARALPQYFTDVRRLFLLYETLFLVLASVYAFVRIRPRIASVPTDTRRWVSQLTTFEYVTYLAWALADVIILAGHDAGFALRLVANSLYYAVFVPFAYLTAPREVRA